MSAADPNVEKLKDAYRALGSAIAELRSMPTRNYAHDEEQLRISAATLSIGEAQGLAGQACEALGHPPIHIPVEPSALGGLRGIARPAVWGQIGQLHEARARVAAILQTHGAEVPDDLPEGSPMEQLARDPRARLAGRLLAAATGLGLAIYVLLSILGG